MVRRRHDDAHDEMLLRAQAPENLREHSRRIRAPGFRVGNGKRADLPQTLCGHIGIEAHCGVLPPPHRRPI